MLFLEMEITSFPQREKPETPSLCPLTTKGSGVQLLFYHKKTNPLLLHVNLQKKNCDDCFSHFLKSHIRRVLSRELETSEWLSGAANCKKEEKVRK